MITKKDIGKQVRYIGPFASLRNRIGILRHWGLSEGATDFAVTGIPERFFFDNPGEFEVVNND